MAVDEKRISESKQSQIAKVMEQYDLEWSRVSSVRSAYKIETSIGPKCLKEFKHHPRKSITVNGLIRHLKKHNFPYTPSMIRTKQKQVHVQHEENYYYLTEWVQGREADFDNLEELLSAVKLLAQFHIAAKGFKPVKGGAFIKQYSDWFTIYEEKKKQLSSFKEVQPEKKTKASFYKIYQNESNKFIYLCDLSIEMIKNANYKEYAKKAEEEGCVCHDSFYYQNVMVDTADQMHIIDLDSCIGDIPIYDLGKLLRRMLDKKYYKWSMEIAKQVIETYTQIVPLDKNELLLLLAVIIFPHKYWKLGTKKFLKMKKWPEKKYERKLKKKIKQHDMIWTFMREYIQEFKLKYTLPAPLENQ